MRHWIFEGLTWKRQSSPESFKRGDCEDDGKWIIIQTWVRLFSQGFLEVGWAALGCRSSLILRVSTVYSSSHTDSCGGSTMCHLYSRGTNWLTPFLEIAFQWGKQAISKIQRWIIIWTAYKSQHVLMKEINKSLRQAIREETEVVLVGAPGSHRGYCMPVPWHFFCALLL